MTIQTRQPAVELCVRSLAPSGTPDPQVGALQRLEALVEAGVVETYSVRVVGRGLVHEKSCLKTAPGMALLQRLAAIDSWAGQNDATVPGIDTVRVETSPVHDRAYRMTTVPELLVLEYLDDELVYVAPCSVRDEHCSVGEYLDAMEQSAGRDLPGRTDGTPVPAPFPVADHLPAETRIEESTPDVPGDLRNAF